MNAEICRWLFDQSGLILRAVTADAKNSPNEPVADNKRGSALAQAGNSDEALPISKPIGLDPNWRTGLRQPRADLSPDPLAIADIKRAIAPDPNNAPAYLGRGPVYKARNQTAEALEYFNKADRARPRQFGKPVAIVSCSIRTKNSPRSTTLPRGIAASCRSRPNRCSHAQSDHGLDKPKEAVNDLDLAVQDEPQHAQGWIMRGLAYEERLGGTS